MISLFTEYLTDIEQQIADHEAQLQEKRQEAIKLQQLESEIDNALVTLKNVVKNIKDVDPEGISLFKKVALSMFGDSEIVSIAQGISSEENIKDRDTAEKAITVTPIHNEEIVDETLSKNGKEIKEITWQKILIKVIYQAHYFQSSDNAHIDICCNQSLPLTNTGYKSIFISIKEVPDLNAAVNYVVNLLDEKASEINWQPENQCCLF